MSDFEELTTMFKKDYGDSIGGQNYAYPEMVRIPTGWFALDLMLGGGIPAGKITEMYGQNASGKSNLALKIIASHQQLYPDKKCVYLDMEGGFESRWAAKLGVDIESLYVFKPDYGEAAIDMIEGLLAAPECGVVVLDSLGSMLDLRDLSNSAEKRNVGGPAFLVTNLVKKVTGALNRAEKENNTPTFIGINQIRTKIGGYGHDTMDTPGGNALRHLATLRLRLHGRKEKDNKVHKDLPCINDTSVIVTKHRFPIISTHGDYQMALIPHKGIKVGECADFNIIKKYMDSHGVVEKNSKGYLVQGEYQCKLVVDIKALLEADTKLKHNICAKIIEVERDKINGSESFDPETGEILSE